LVVEGVPKEFGRTIFSSPSFAVGFIGTEVVTDVVLGKVGVKVGGEAKALGARIFEGATDLKTTVFGEQFIDNISRKPTTLSIDSSDIRKTISFDTRDFSKSILGKTDQPGIELGIIQGRDDFLKVNPLGAVDEFGDAIKLKKDPAIPKLNRLQESIIGDIKTIDPSAQFTGSFAAEAQVKGTRKFQDIDVLVSDPFDVAQFLKTTQGDKINIIKQKITGTKFGDFEIFRVTDPKTGKVIADLDPIKFGEEGFLKKFGTKEVGGLELADPRARLASKVEQLGKSPLRVLQTPEKAKVILDVEQLSGAKLADKTFLRGPFGFSDEFMKQFVGKRGPVASSAQGLLPLISDDVALTQTFFASPFEVIDGKATGRGLVRKTFLQKNKPGANLLDLLTEDIKFGADKPQIALFEDALITEKGGDGAFSIIRKTSGELEVTAGPKPPKSGVAGILEDTTGSVEIVKKVGTSKVAIVDGKRVPIISTELGVASPELSSLIRKRKSGADLTNVEVKKLKRLRELETGFTQAEVSELASKNIQFSSVGTATTTLGFVGTTKGSGVSNGVSRPTSTSSFLLRSSRGSRSGKSSLSLSSFSSSVSSSPSRSLSSSSFSPSISAPSSSSSFSFSSGFSGGGSSVNRRIIPKPPIKPIIKPFTSSRITRKQKPQDTFLVRVRERGKFKARGTRRTLSQAFSLGKRITDRELSATFNIKGLGRGLGLSQLKEGKKFKRKKVRGISGLTFIEQPKFRLDTPSEVSLIQSAKRRSKK